MIYIVDTFTSEMYKGNPAAVIVTDVVLDINDMKKISCELCQPKSIFIRKESDITYTAKCFTSEKEVDICLHATMAASHIVLNVIDKELTEVKFISNGNSLIAFNNSGDISLIASKYMTTHSQYDIDFKSIFDCNYFMIGHTYYNDYIIRVDDIRTLKMISPNYLMLEQINCDGVIVTCSLAEDNSKYDFASRYFCPKLGINEDQVCGLAHVALAEYWSPIFNKSVLNAIQLSKRTGEIQMVVKENDIEIRGESVVTFIGKLY